MIRVARRLMQALALTALVATVHGQSGSGPEFKVVYWYDRADPVGSFRSQPYDLRKNEYNGARVEAWMAMMARDFPRFAAYVRTINLDQFPGQTDQEKLTAASSGELKPLIDSAISALKLKTQIVERSALKPRPFEADLPSPIGAARFSPKFEPPRYPMPIPYPYPRPHP